MAVLLRWTAQRRDAALQPSSSQTAPHQLLLLVAASDTTTFVRRRRQRQLMSLWSAVVRLETHEQMDGQLAAAAAAAATCQPRSERQRGQPADDAETALLASAVVMISSRRTR